MFAEESPLVMGTGTKRLDLPAHQSEPHLVQAGAPDSTLHLAITVALYSHRMQQLLTPFEDIRSCVSFEEISAEGGTQSGDG